MNEAEKVEALSEIGLLLADGLIPPRLMQFYDFGSEERLEDKLRVLRALKDGKEFDEIEGAYGILESYPDDGVLWD